MIKTFTWDRERREIEIDPVKVKKFSLTNRREWTTKRTFKKFYKVGHITMITGEYFAVSEWVIKELKENLKGKYTATKEQVFEYKNGQERKAIDWYYNITA